MKSINKTFYSVFFLCAWLLTIYLGACSLPRSDYMEITTPTPSNSNSETKHYTEFINKEGWHVPLPGNVKKGPKKAFRMTSASGKQVDAVDTTMIFSDDYRFTFGSMTEEQKSYLNQGELKLVALKELRVGRNVFAYVIMAENAETGMKMSGNEPHQHPFFYKIVDQDGDGKFETLYPGDSDNLVPDWASR
jgi:hypothetical protein